ncbi:MAG: SufD family Fe-S cluster assembly protein [Muribaculaceae bacterium]|nr:SufD family Fe-S cluster assembly protein [Muribaculaceae bacterium]
MTEALRQYVDLYRSHSDLIDSHSAPALNALREEACSTLESANLPAHGTENYEHTDLTALLSPDYGINLARTPMDVNPAASFRCDVPHLSTSLFFLINDTFAASDRSYEGLPAGVTVMGLARFAREYPEVAAAHYGRLADMKNPVVALNTMLCQDGVVIYVRKGVKVEKPLQLVNILHSGMPLMAVRRLLVIMEEDSEARLLVCDHTQVPDMKFLTLQTVEIYAGERSRFDLYDLEESTESTSRLSSLYLRQEGESSVMIDGITLYNGTTRNEYHTLFAAPGSELKLYGMGIEDAERSLETYSRIAHEAGGCMTDELFKYVVDDRATGSFTGRIYVAEGAAKTEAYQANRNIVGSDEARMFAKPQLEIYNDDVKCSHGTAIGRLDEMQLFYMRTRGLSEDEARLLLKQAFMADVIDGVRLEVLRERLRHLVERRFAGEAAGCGSCSLHSHPGCAPQA